MLDEIMPVNNWGDFLNICFTKAADRGEGRCYTLRLKAKWGLNKGEQNMVLGAGDLAGYEARLNSLVKGGEEECAIKDLDSPSKLTIRKLSRGNMEILGTIIRDNPGYESSKDSVMHYKFQIKPEGVLDILNLLAYLRNQ